MTLQERLRDKTRLRRIHGLTGWVLHEESLTTEAADALDAKDARITELEGALCGMIDLAEFWIDREDRRGKSETEYNTWLALGMRSKAMQRAREALK